MKLSKKCWSYIVRKYPTNPCLSSSRAGHDDSHLGVAPWVGYQGEDELRAKILSLSEDKRNFVRAPPSGVTFEFEYSSVAATALALLQEDPQLQTMRCGEESMQISNICRYRFFLYESRT